MICRCAVADSNRAFIQPGLRAGIQWLGLRSMAYPASDPDLDLSILLAHLVRRERTFRRPPQHSTACDIKLRSVTRTHERCAGQDARRELTAFMGAEIIEGE